AARRAPGRRPRMAGRRTRQAGRRVPALERQLRLRAPPAAQRQGLDAGPARAAHPRAPFQPAPHRRAPAHHRGHAARMRDPGGGAARAAGARPAQRIPAEHRMKILIQNGRVIDPASGRDEMADVAIAAGRIIATGRVAADFHPTRVIDASGGVGAPGLVDLAVRLREPGQEHAGMLESETAAAVAGGVTSLVCPPDTDPVLDEPGLVDMLKFRAEKLHRSRVFPLGALTRGLGGEALTEMAELTEAGCVGFGQAEVPILSTQVLQRALQSAATFGYTVWLRPQDLWLGKGVAA